jgi:hypothetical protein
MNYGVGVNDAKLNLTCVYEKFFENMVNTTYMYITHQLYPLGSVLFRRYQHTNFKELCAIPEK